MFRWFRKERIDPKHEAIVVYVSRNPLSTVAEIAAGVELEENEVLSILSEDPVVKKKYQIGFGNKDTKYFYETAGHSY